MTHTTIYIIVYIFIITKVSFICNRLFFYYNETFSLSSYDFMERKFIFNLKMLLAGVILRVIIFWYLQQHPGEKQSLLPSLQTLYSKGEVFFYGLLGKDTASIETKQSLQKMYTEISYLIETSHCDATALIQEVEESRAAIDALDYSQAQNNKYNYYLKAVELKDKIQKQCGIATDTTGTAITGSVQTGTI